MTNKQRKDRRTKCENVTSDPPVGPGELIITPETIDDQRDHLARLLGRLLARAWLDEHRQRAPSYLASDDPPKSGRL